MADLPIEPLEEPEEESSFGKNFLRVAAVFLSTLFGFLLVLLGYIAAIFMSLDLEKFNDHASIYFSVSIVLWIIAGL